MVYLYDLVGVDLSYCYVSDDYNDIDYADLKKSGDKYFKPEKKYLLEGIKFFSG